MRANRNDRSGNQAIALQRSRDAIHPFVQGRKIHPLVVEKLRHHTYHLTGLRVYDYRTHKDQAKAAFAELPVFVGVGEKDTLALNSARSLRKALADAGAKAVTYKEYAGAEHLVIVREALPDVSSRILSSGTPRR